MATAAQKPRAAKKRMPRKASSRQKRQAMAGIMRLRKYQLPVFRNRASKIELLVWGRQQGKSTVLAGWAVDRLLTRPGRCVTVLSNSRDNGAEFVERARAIIEDMEVAMQQVAEEVSIQDLSEDLEYDSMRFEIRIKVAGKTGRIKVLAANPRTARGFSGDLILDEFAWHEKSREIWEAAEPIISSNPDFLCRIASTFNGRRNMFYQLYSDGRYPVSFMPRSKAWAMGELKIFSNITGEEITPDQARAESSDKRAYDQNYECIPGDENSALLPFDLITAAERCPAAVTIDQQAFSADAISRMWRAENDLYFGMDLGRVRDLSFIAVIERVGQIRRTIACLEMDGMSGPDQLVQLAYVIQSPRFKRGAVDLTGMGTFFYDWAVAKFGSARIEGINFSTTEPINEALVAEGRKNATAKVTELMAIDLREVFEDRLIEIPADAQLRDDLRKPERIVSPGGRVSIAAARDAEGHADRFWGYALAERAQRHGAWTFAPRVPQTGKRATAMRGRRERSLAG